MLKKIIPIIPIGLSIFVVILILVYAVFVKPEPVVPVNPPVVNNDITPTPPIPTPPTPPIKEVIVPEEEIIASKEELPKEVSYWKSPIKVFISPRPTYEESNKRHKEMRSDRETYTDNVYIKDEKTGKEILLARLNNINYGARFGEYHNGHLYVTKEFYDYGFTYPIYYDYDYGTSYHGYNYPNLRRELWKYDLEGNKEKLFSAKGISTFKVDPKEKFVAVNNLILDINTLEVKFEMDAKALIYPKPFEKEYDGKSGGKIKLDLNQWSSNGKYFWGNLSYHWDPQQFFKINTENWKVTKYDVSSLPISPKEQILNLDVEKIFYSDMPVFLETDAVDEFKQSGKQVTLYLYDLNSKKNKVIDKITADKITYDGFQLEWIDNSTIEYTKDGKRITLKVI